jgi:predicted enzyme related to lactoylglutathione lyase
MKRKSNGDSGAVGLGGVFFRANNPAKLSTWYRKHLGIKTTNNIALFTWRSSKGSKKTGHTVWAIFPSDTSYFRNSRKQFMFNYRVKSLDKVLAKLRRERVKVAKKVEDSKYGRFAWVSDPEGSWLELWQPPRKYDAPEEEIPME